MQRWFDVTRTIPREHHGDTLPAEEPGIHHAAGQGRGLRPFSRPLQRTSSVNTLTPDIRIHVFIEDDRLMLYLDTSGDALFKRGVRQHTNIAPIRENLAAGILRLSGWKPGTPLLDPMCGSGTFLIGGGADVAEHPAGHRARFCVREAEELRCGAMGKLREQAISAQLSAKPLEIYGSDLYGDALKTAGKNLAEAGLAECVTTQAGQRAGNPAPAEHGVWWRTCPMASAWRTGRTGGAVPETGRCAEEKVRRLDRLPVHRRQGHPKTDAIVTVKAHPAV